MESRSNNNPIRQYIIGSENFRHHYFANNNNLYHHLVDDGQKPNTLLIACCDSRQHPTNILNMAPGEAFVVRTIANIVPPYNETLTCDATAAGLEYGVQILKVKHIIIMGHSHCGGIQALINNTNNTSPLRANSFITSWVNIAKSTVENVLHSHSHLSQQEQSKACEEASLRASLKNLESYPWIKEKIERGEVQIHAWRFDLKTGIIQSYHPNSNTFEDLTLEKATLLNTPPKLSAKL